MASQSQNLLPSPLHGLSLREVFLFTGIPLYLIEGFIKGKFKPSPSDRKKLSRASLLFYKWNEAEKRAFVERRKYREVRNFLSIEEKENLFNQPEKNAYGKRLDALIEAHWEEIVLNIAERENAQVAYDR